MKYALVMEKNPLRLLGGVLKNSIAFLSRTRVVRSSCIFVRLYELSDRYY